MLLRKKATSKYIYLRNTLDGISKKHFPEKNME